MRWHRFMVDRGMSPEYLLLSREIRGLHMEVLIRCAKAENGGRYVGAGTWPTSAWPQITGVTRHDMERLVDAKLARWVGVLMPSIRIETLETGSNAPGSTPDRPIHAGSNVRSEARSAPVDQADLPCFERFDLVVEDFDHEGEMLVNEGSADQSKRAKKGWIKRRNEARAALGLPPVPSGESFDPDRVPAPDPAYAPASDPAVPGHPIRQSKAQHSGSDPPLAPPGGGEQITLRGVRADGRTPGPYAAAFVDFWAWLGAALPSSMDREKWYHPKPRVWQRVKERSHSLGLSVEDVCGRMQQDLTAKLSSPAWVRGTADPSTGRGRMTIVTYAGGDIWVDPAKVVPFEPRRLPSSPSAPKDPDAFIRAAMSDEDMPPAQKERLKAGWLADPANAGRRPPWEQHAANS